MSKDFFWGLTVRDFERGFWNDMNQVGIFFAGATAAVITHALVNSLMNQGNTQRLQKPQLSRLTPLVAIVVGIATTVAVANRLNHVTFIAEKALKFLVIALVAGAGGGTLFGTPGAIIGWIGMGGALGYFGRGPLYVLGSLGALVGTGLMNGRTKGPLSKKL